MFSTRLLELRKDKNLTQKQLAEKLVLSKNSICEYEKGRSEPNIETLIKLADIFDCSVDYLIDRSDNLFEIDERQSNENKEHYLLTKYRSFSSDEKNFIIKVVEFISSKH